MQRANTNETINAQQELLQVSIIKDYLFILNLPNVGEFGQEVWFPILLQKYLDHRMIIYWGKERNLV